MCLSCGCGCPSDPHGDERNIVLAQLAAAAGAAGITPMQAAANLLATVGGRKGDLKAARRALPKVVEGVAPGEQP